MPLLSDMKLPQRIYQLSETAIVAEWEQRVDAQIAFSIRQLQQTISASFVPGLIEMVPAYASLTFFYEPREVLRALSETGTSAAEKMRSFLQQKLQQLKATDTTAHKTTIQKEIPVCYGGEYGPDLGLVATHCGISEAEVIRLHSHAVYQVYMIGFVPGFAYLGGMPEQLATPRRSAPRPRVAAGTVGIAGVQTGIYPMEITGGWQLIGRTSQTLFSVDKNPPSWLQAGDEVVFIPVSALPQ